MDHINYYYIFDTWWSWANRFAVCLRDALPNRLHPQLPDSHFTLSIVDIALYLAATIFLICLALLSSAGASVIVFFSPRGAEAVIPNLPEAFVASATAALATTLHTGDQHTVTFAAIGRTTAASVARIAGIPPGNVIVADRPTPEALATALAAIP